MTLSSSSSFALREAVWRGEVPVLPATEASRRLVRRALALVAEAFDALVEALPTLHERGDAAEQWQRTCRARAALRADVNLRRGAVDLAGALGFESDTLAYDPPRLRVVTPGGHDDPAAARAYYMHRDTWYGSPRAQVNAWLPLFDVDERDSLVVFPQALGALVDNDSAAFDYDAFRGAGGFQSTDPIAAAYPRCLDAPPEPALRVRARAAEVVLFAAAQLHGTAPNLAGRTRLSIDLRLVDLRDHERGRGASDADNRSRGSALGDYVRVEHAAGDDSPA